MLIQNCIHFSETYAQSPCCSFVKLSVEFCSAVSLSATLTSTSRRRCYYRKACRTYTQGWVVLRDVVRRNIVRVHNLIRKSVKFQNQDNVKVRIKLRKVFIINHFRCWKVSIFDFEKFFRELICVQ